MKIHSKEVKKMTQPWNGADGLDGRIAGSGPLVPSPSKTPPASPQTPKK